MEVRIGVIHTPKELLIEVDGSNADDLVATLRDALEKDDGVVWLQDVRGRRIGVPIQKVAYVEIDAEGTEKRVGFGRG
jgi:hypothetical protein